MNKSLMQQNAQRQQALRQKMGIKKNIRINMQYGHNDTHIVLLLGAKVDNITMDETQCQAMIDALASVKKLFAAYKAKKNGTA